MQITKEAGVDEDVKPAAFVYEMVQVYEPEKQRINLEIFLFLFFFFFFFGQYPGQVSASTTWRPSRAV